MKKILFLCFVILSTMSFANDEPQTEIKIFENENLVQQFYGVVIQDGENHVFIHRDTPEPPADTRYYARWRLINLAQDETAPTRYYLTKTPISQFCIVPFVNGVMSMDFMYDQESNYIQFLDSNNQPETLPEDYKVSALILLSP